MSDPAVAPLNGLHELHALLREPGEPDLSIEIVAPEETPEPARSLLDHHDHMTLAQERYWKQPVQVGVLGPRLKDDTYGRKSYLHLGHGGPAIQYNMMSIDLRQVNAEVRAQIEEGRIPLGRILIDHGIMRRVQYHALLRISPSEEMRRIFRCDESRPVYGRVASIDVNGQPAVQLLEVVAPL